MDWLEYKNTYLKNRTEEELKFIEKAFHFAEKAHQNQKRLSGESYFSHPVEISKNIISLNFDAKTIAAALLHDTLEDGKTTLKEIKSLFGDEVAFLVDGVTKVNAIKYKGIERTVESIKKMFLAVAEDLRIVILKIFDRLHNMETLYVHSPEKQKRIALETLDIYASIADRLGMGEVKAKLEDLAFLYVYPEEYQWLLSRVKEKIHEREIYLKNLIPILQGELKKENINIVEIGYRAKHYYSLWRKLRQSDMDFSRIYDLAACRIIVKNIEDCYAALGVVHKLWRPLPGRIKDYIALPKPNGYQSLHTTVFCRDKKITEFQIRTLEMHQEAENGIAAHWAWSETGKPKKGEPKSNKFAWVEQLRNWQKERDEEENISSGDFLESLKIDFFKDRIFVLTPKGDVIDLPEGATPIDFAYAIHSEIGDSANGAKVNNILKPLSHTLSSGDIVEILIQKGKKPNREWLNFVKTQNAKSRIRYYFKLPPLDNSSPFYSDYPKKRKIILKVEDRVGLLKDVSSVFSHLKINIQNLESVGSASLECPQISISFTLQDSSKLSQLKLKLKNIKGVEEIKVL